MIAVKDSPFTLEKLEQHLHFSKGYLSGITTGRIKRPGGDKSTAIANALGVRVEWLIDGAGPMRNPGPELFIDDEYPMRAKAFELLSRRGSEYADAIASVKGSSYMDAEVWSEMDWIHEIAIHHARRSRPAISRPLVVDEPRPPIGKRNLKKK